MVVVIFVPNWLGDLVMATPALRAIRRHFGSDARLVGIMRPYLADVLHGTDFLDEQWYWDPRAKQPALWSPALVRRMRRERFDVAVLLPNSLRPAVVSALGGVRQRVGYVRYGRGPLLTRKLAPPRIGRRLAAGPMVDYYLRVAEKAGCPLESPRLELATTAADERSADGVWERLGLRDGGHVVALNPSGAYGESKRWPLAHFADLARRIVDHLDHDVLVTCGPAERSAAREIVRLCRSPRVVSMADQPLDLGTAKACIRRSRLMLSTDSGLRHVAAAFGKPMVTLYGPILPVWSGNPTQHAVDLTLDLSCIGCHKRVCPLKHHRCMRDLSVETAYRAVAGLIEERKPLIAA